MEKELGGFRKKVTVISFLMQLGIVMVHMNTDQYFEIHTSGGFLDGVCEWIYRLCFDGGVVSLSFFMVCAAFLLYYNLTKENMLLKVRRRFSSLLIPFLIWNGIGMIFYAFYWWNTEGFAAYCLSMLRPLYLWVILDKKWLTFPLKWWMENQFFMYAVHYFFILAIVPILCRVYAYVTPGTGFVTVWRFVCFFLITLLCEAVGWVLMRFTPRLYAACTGGRVPKC